MDNNSSSIFNNKNSDIKHKILFMNSIQVQAWAGIFLVTVLPLVLLGISSFKILTDISRDLLVKSNLQAFQQVKYEINEYVKNYEKLIKFLAKDKRLKKPSSKDAKTALQQIDKSYEFIDRIIICSRNGQIIQHSKKADVNLTGLTVPEEMALSASQTVLFSPEAFQVKIPLNEVKNKPYLIATISFLKLRKSLEGISFGTDFHYYLVTNDGENILEQPNFPKEIISALLEKPSGAYAINETGLNKGKSQVAISLPILNYNLKVFVFQDANEVYQIASTIKKRTYVVVFILALLALISGTVFIRHFTTPIIQIAQKAEELSNGNLQVSVKINREDEIGLLASCFNKMTAKIRNKVFELSSLYKISRLISSASTYQQALDSCLSHITEIFLAKRGSIMLLNEDKTKLKVASYKVSGETTNDKNNTSENANNKVFELKIGEGIAGQVAETGKAILCSDCTNDERFKNYEDKDNKNSPLTLVSAPLKVNNKIIGVINLADRATGTLFNEGDLALLQSIASQMAISIDNAKLKELALTDESTGLFVEKYFYVRLEDEIKRAKRFEIPLAMALIEIKNLTEIINKHGNKAKNTVVNFIAKTLIISVRGTDVACHYKNEAFAAILAHTNEEQALMFAKRLHESIKKTEIKYENQTLNIILSIGISTLALSDNDKNKFIKNCEEALKECNKKENTNYCQVFPESKETSSKHKEPKTKS